mmetsp:Transcript_2998/g.6930  ORF Transcript_2998/g.6930 Transcript_2998/m.6930 type:complete len:221 (-) Transcript_2998:1636-2298(-)
MSPRASPARAGGWQRHPPSTSATGNRSATCASRSGRRTATTGKPRHLLRRLYDTEKEFSVVDRLRHRAQKETASGDAGAATCIAHTAEIQSPGLAATRKRTENVCAGDESRIELLGRETHTRNRAGVVCLRRDKSSEEGTRGVCSRDAPGGTAGSRDPKHCGCRGPQENRGGGCCQGGRLGGYAHEATLFPPLACELRQASFLLATAGREIRRCICIFNF